MLVKTGIFPNFRGENKKYLKPPPSFLHHCVVFCTGIHPRHRLLSPSVSPFILHLLSKGFVDGCQPGEKAPYFFNNKLVYHDWLMSTWYALFLSSLYMEKTVNIFTSISPIKFLLYVEPGAMPSTESTLIKLSSIHHRPKMVSIFLRTSPIWKSQWNHEFDQATSCNVRTTVHRPAQNYIWRFGVMSSDEWRMIMHDDGWSWMIISNHERWMIKYEKTHLHPRGNSQGEVAHSIL